jgi:Ni/Co efflux regulator RcnB
MSDEQAKPTKVSLGLIILLLLALMIVVGFFVPPLLEPGMGTGAVTLAWLIIGLLMLLAFGYIGKSSDKGWLGVLIDNRNMMSLSRLQIILWTVVLVSAIFTVSLARINDSIFDAKAYDCEEMAREAKEGEEVDCADPIGIQLPAVLWALMGISITTAVGSPMIKAAKAERTADQDRNRENVAATRDRSSTAAPPATYDRAMRSVKTDAPEDTTQNVGVMVKKETWQDARFSDMFKGEEISTYKYVDVAKVQNFFFTIITIIAYTVALASGISLAESIAKFYAFPDVPGGLLAMIGISHGGYLTAKAFTHTTPE